MLRSAVSAILVVAAAAGARAQDARVLPADVAEVDFILRPSQDTDFDSADEFWRLQLEPDEPGIDAPIGPPLAGPTGAEPIGPPLAGPVPPPPEELPAVVTLEAETDPFAPTGAQVGTFVIRPSIEIGVSATDNAGGRVDEEAAVGLVVEPEINIRSEDERHEIEANLRGEAVFYDNDEFDDREAEARLRARYDLTSRTSIDAEAGYSSTLESFTDPDTPEAAVERPAVHSFDALLGATQRFGPLSLGAAGFAKRAIYEDVTLAGGGAAARDELDNTEFGLRVRGGYEVSGSITPFADVAVGRRDFDRKVDSAGLERSSLSGELRGGIIFDFGSRLRGEVALGYRREDIDDAALEDIDAFVADASILWSPRRLTEVRLDLSTDTKPTTLTGASASILYSGTLTVARRITPRFRVEVGASIDHERFVGADRADTTYSAFTGVSYAFSRVLSLKASYEYERTERGDSSPTTDANVIGVRLRIQR